MHECRAVFGRPAVQGLLGQGGRQGERNKQSGRRLLPFAVRVGAVLLSAWGLTWRSPTCPVSNHTALASGLSARVSGLSYPLTNLDDPPLAALPARRSRARRPGRDHPLATTPSLAPPEPPSQRNAWSRSAWKRSARATCGPDRVRVVSAHRSEASARTAEAGARDRGNRTPRPSWRSTLRVVRAGNQCRYASTRGGRRCEPRAPPIGAPRLLAALAVIASAAGVAPGSRGARCQWPNWWRRSSMWVC